MNRDQGIRVFDRLYPGNGLVTAISRLLRPPGAEFDRPVPLAGRPCGGWFWYPDGLPAGNTISMLSSRLGRDACENPVVIRALRTFFATLNSDQVVVTSAGVTLDNPLRRGARLFDQRLIRFVPLPKRFSETVARNLVADRPWSNEHRIFYDTMAHPDRDELLLAASDQSRLLAVRRSGNLHRLLKRRFGDGQDPLPSILLSLVDDRLNREDMQCELRELGCHDWWVCQTGSEPPGETGIGRYRAPLVELGQIKGQFLSHWTRAVHHHWPDQNQLSQWDQALLGGRGMRGALATLCRILSQQTILSSGRLIRGGRPMCCFTAVPLAEFPGRRVYRRHLARWDFESFGIAIRAAALRRCGARPVRYVSGQVCRIAPSVEQAWTVTRDSAGRWSQEQEWRLAGDLDLRRLAGDEAMVFVRDAKSAEIARQFSRWPVTILPPAKDSRPVPDGPSVDTACPGETT